MMSLLVNLSYEFEQIMARYDFLEARRVILSNVRNDSNLTGFSYEVGTIMTMTFWMLDL